MDEKLSPLFYGNFMFIKPLNKFVTIWNQKLHEVDFDLNVIKKSNINYNLFEGLKLFGKRVGWSPIMYQAVELDNRYFVLDVDKEVRNVILKEFIYSSRKLIDILTVPGFDLKIYDLHGKIFIFEEQLHVSNGKEVFTVEFDETDQNKVNLSKHQFMKSSDYYNFHKNNYLMKILYGDKIVVILPRTYKQEFLAKLQPDHNFMSYINKQFCIFTNYNQTKIRLINVVSRQYLDIGQYNKTILDYQDFSQAEVKNHLEISDYTLTLSEQIQSAIESENLFLSAKQSNSNLTRMSYQNTMMSQLNTSNMEFSNERSFLTQLLDDNQKIYQQQNLEKQQSNIKNSNAFSKQVNDQNQKQIYFTSGLGLVSISSDHKLDIDFDSENIKSDGIRRSSSIEEVQKNSVECQKCESNQKLILHNLQKIVNDDCFYKDNNSFQNKEDPDQKKSDLALYPLEHRESVQHLTHIHHQPQHQQLNDVQQMDEIKELDENKNDIKSDSNNIHKDTSIVTNYIQEMNQKLNSMQQYLELRLNIIEQKIDNNTNIHKQTNKLLEDLLNFQNSKHDWEISKTQFQK